jgi:hypothetical protein
MNIIQSSTRGLLAYFRYKAELLLIQCLEDLDQIVLKVYNVKIASMALLLLSIFTLASFAAWTNISYAQLLQPGTGQALLSQSQNKQVLPNANLSQNIQHIKNAVKITSPNKHQQIPIDKNLIITGTTTSRYQGLVDNPATSHCQVSIIVNGIKPYHTATATGPGGAADYSKWKFLLSSNYTTIEQGPNNKITARYTCSSHDHNMESFNSVNVTGV